MEPIQKTLVNGKSTEPSPFTLIVPSIAGNLLEYYDFSIYGFLAPLLGPLFFPNTNKLLSLIAAFGVFAIGALVRPVGAIIFSYIGDRWGRKKTLALTIILMASASTLIGFLPTYQDIGIMAAILLLTCRIVQGLALGGEFAGSIVYLTEHAPPTQRGLYGSWVMFSTFAGILLGSAVSTVTTHLFSIHWAWRIPFLLSFFLGMTGFYLRLYLPETPQFAALIKAERTLKNPVLTAFRNHSGTLLKATSLDFLPAVAFYLLFIYLTTYLNLYFKVPLNTALLSNTLSLILVVLLIPILGAVSDKIGRKKIMFVGATAFIILFYPLLLEQGTWNSILIAQLLFGIAIAFCCAPMPTTFSEMYTTDMRYTGVALPYNIANALFGGTIPLILSVLLEKTGNTTIPGYCLGIAGVIMFLTLLTVKETYLQPLPE
jgi:MFS transporter, MHS family, proline/betaine transporter